ncbi:MAG TPA: hypothetical protein VNA69_01840 [Thermoanaerobaculia bacterium]|nr:hypothetical protein [Thermoanaerobaculia bacterium]
MRRIVIHPDRIRQFGDAADATFCLVTNPEFENLIEIDRSGTYRNYLKLRFAPGDDFEEILAHQIPARAHVLVISPAAFYRSPPNDKVGAERKLLAMACNSTPTTLDAIDHFLGVMEATDPVEQQEMADAFFRSGERASHLQLVDYEIGTSARFNHRSDNYLWNEQAGTLGWGEQQLAPAGEISVLPLAIQDFDERLHLAIDGTIALKGHPILHHGEPSFLPADQERIYRALATMQQAAVIATVEHGVISDIQPSETCVTPAIEVLSAMFSTDSRYRTIWEVGFAINTRHELYPGNCAMNEVHGGTGGTIHFGLGLTPYTQYHFDMICPGTTVIAGDGESLIGDRSTMARIRGASCGCST